MKTTVKTAILVVILSISLLVLTGCANVNYEITLNKDGSGDVSYIMGYDKSFLSSMNVSVDDLKKDNSFDDMKKDASEEGYEVEEYEDDNTYGFKAHKHVDNIQNEFKMQDDSKDEDAIHFEKGLFKTKYWQDATLDLTDIDAGQEGQSNAITSALLKQMKISYKITLPFKVGDNNATTVSEDGKTLEWTLTAGQTNDVKFIAEETSYIIAGIGIIAVFVIVILAIISGNKKGKEKSKPVTIKKEEAKKDDSNK